MPKDDNPVGSYRRTFVLPEAWRDRQVFLHFEAVQSASTVWVNGREVGYNEGGLEPAEYDVTCCPPIPTPYRPVVGGEARERGSGAGGKIPSMMDLRADPDSVRCEPDVDANGVDLAQVQEMLDLRPAGRLLVIQNLADAVAEIRALDGPRPVR